MAKFFKTLADIDHEFKDDIQFLQSTIKIIKMNYRFQVATAEEQKIKELRMVSNRLENRIQQYVTDFQNWELTNK